jgi:hypothetical protein
MNGKKNEDRSVDPEDERSGLRRKIPQRRWEKKVNTRAPLIMHPMMG